jgi:GntR family transcriptional regulator / MocR family aminotransferase
MVMLQDGDDPIYLRLYKAIREHVTSGRWPAGMRLPSTRLLAEDLGIARGTAALAMDQLISEGWLVSEARSGVFVPRSGRAVARCQSESEAPRAPLRSASFRELTTPTQLFPIARWRQHQSKVWSSVDAAELLGAENAGGHPRLRDVIARLTCGSRGVTATADQVLVCSSVQVAVEITLRTHLSPHASVVLETPGDPTLAARLRRAGFSVLAVAVDKDGIRTCELPAAADAVVVSPAMHLPLGMTLTGERRQKLLAWAAEVNAVIVELDCEGHMGANGGRPNQPLSVSNPDSEIVYVRDFDRVTYPGLNLAFAVIPGGVDDDFRQTREDVDRCLPVSDQLVLADFIASGGLASHLRSMKPALKKLREAAEECVRRASGPALLELRAYGNLVHLVTAPGATLPTVTILQEAGIPAWSTSDLGTGPNTGDQGILLAVTASDPEVLTGAMRRLGNAVKLALS